MTRYLCLKNQFCFLSLVLASSCAGPEGEISRDRHSPDFERTAALSFFNGEVNGLFANAKSFEAHLEVDATTSVPATDQGPALSGELWGRDGKLLFVPAPSSRRHKYAGTAGTTFVWDISANNGFALNDLLQGYAPLPHDSSATNGPASAESMALGTEVVNGEECQKIQVTYHAPNDGSNIVIVWRAPSLSGLPIKIQTGGGLNANLLRLSKVRFETPPADVFTVPEGSTRYDNVDAMMYELARREGEARGVHGSTPDFPGAGAPYRR